MDKNGKLQRDNHPTSRIHCTEPYARQECDPSRSGDDRPNAAAAPHAPNEVIDSLAKAASEQSCPRISCTYSAQIFSKTQETLCGDCTGGTVDGLMLVERFRGRPECDNRQGTQSQGLRYPNSICRQAQTILYKNRMLLSQPAQMWKEYPAYPGSRPRHRTPSGTVERNSSCSANPSMAHAKPRVHVLKGEYPCCELGQR